MIDEKTAKEMIGATIEFCVWMALLIATFLLTYAGKMTIGEMMICFLLLRLSDKVLGIEYKM